MIAVQPSTVFPASRAIKLCMRPASRARIQASITLGWRRSRATNNKSSTGSVATNATSARRSRARMGSKSTSVSAHRTRHGNMGGLDLTNALPAPQVDGNDVAGLPPTSLPDQATGQGAAAAQTPDALATSRAIPPLWGFACLCASVALLPFAQAAAEATLTGTRKLGVCRDKIVCEHHAAGQVQINRSEGDFGSGCCSIDSPQSPDFGQAVLAVAAGRSSPLTPPPVSSRGFLSVNPRSLPVLTIHPGKLR